MIGGYFGLFNYCYIKDNHLTKDEVLAKIDWFIAHGNNRTYDMIDYEWLICMELKFGHDEQIANKINTLKNMIAKNYLLKEKMKARITLNAHNE